MNPTVFLSFLIHKVIAMAFLGSWTRGLYKSLKETIGGVFAITVSNFVELNVKRGLQFEVREKSTGVAIATSEYWLFRTGPDPVILKRRVVVTNSNEIDFIVYPNPTITDDGVAQPIRNYNEVTPGIAAVTFYKGPTFSAKGTQNAIDYIPGAPNVGGRSSGAFSQQGFERILKANNDYLIEIKNAGDNTLTYLIELSWYEGTISPLGPTEDLIPN